jgi:hypothetical protein
LQKAYDIFGICKSVQKDYHYEKDENGDPLISECQKNDFALYYTSPESLTVFDALYNNKQGLQDKFISYWEKTSAKFASN